LSTDPEMRGRVMALYMAVFMGGTPIGAPIIGWVGQTFGARWTILVGGLVSAVCALVALAWAVHSQRLGHRGLRGAVPAFRRWTAGSARARAVQDAAAAEGADTTSAA
jgi:MFS family permease